MGSFAMTKNLWSFFVNYLRIEIVLLFMKYEEGLLTVDINESVVRSEEHVISVRKKPSGTEEHAELLFTVNLPDLRGFTREFEEFFEKGSTGIEYEYRRVPYIKSYSFENGVDNFLSLSDGDDTIGDCLICRESVQSGDDFVSIPEFEMAMEKDKIYYCIHRNCLDKFLQIFEDVSQDLDVFGEAL